MVRPRTAGASNFHCRPPSTLERSLRRHCRSAGPYVGCTEGSLSELDRALSLLRKYNLRAILDVHAIIGSQNGFDNSGQAKRIRWTLVRLL